MNTIREIESAIERLDDNSLEQLSSWFEHYLTGKWENRFAADVKAGKLNKLGNAADHAFEKGICKPL
jgi:hypothetical protein